MPGDQITIRRFIADDFDTLSRSMTASPLAPLKHAYNSGVMPYFLGHGNAMDAAQKLEEAINLTRQLSPTDSSQEQTIKNLEKHLRQLANCID